MNNTFCTSLANFTCTNPPPPIGNFPNNMMTCVHKVDDLEDRYIFVGNRDFNNTGRSNALANSENNIATILNVAYDVNDLASIQLEIPQLYPPKLPNTKFYDTLLCKVGLIDGPENKMMQVISALYMAEKLLYFPTPENQVNDGMVNIYANGNLLIHCYDGGSRSVTVAALFIYYKYYVNTSTSFEDIYKRIICYRFQKAPNHHPTSGICETAFKIVSTFSQIFPEPVYRT